MQSVSSGLSKFQKQVICTTAIVITLLALVMILPLVFRSTGNVKYDIYVLDVKDGGSQSVNTSEGFVAASSEHTFLFSGHIIYEYFDGKLDAVKDLGQENIQYMAVTDDYLIYYTTGSDMTYRMDIETREEIGILEYMVVDGIYVYGNDYFISVAGKYKDSERTYFSETYLFEGDDVKGIKLETFLKENDVTTERLAGYEVMLKGEYGRYTIYGGRVHGSSTDMISFVETEDGLCLLENQAVYVFDGKLLSFGRNEYVLDGETYTLYTLREESVGVFASLTARYGDKIYTLYQVGTGYTAGKPNPITNKYDVLVQISPVEGKEDVIYKTNGAKERIVGFDMTKEVVYLYNSDGEVCSVDLETNQETVLLDNVFGRNRLYFEWCGDRLFVFKDTEAFDYEFVGAVK